MKKRYSSTIVLAGIIAIGSLYFFNRSAEREDATAPDRSASDSISPGATQKTSGAVVDPPSASSTTEQQESLAPLPPNEQVKASRRMVAAHVSLRSPEVDDPDSETNRRVMQQMVMQAFENADSGEDSRR